MIARRIRTFLPAAALILAALIIIAIGTLLHRPSVQKSPLGEVSVLRISMERAIRTQGAERAYQDFKTTYGGNQPLAHNAAHIFGESLYRVDGLDGMHACDASFNFGCYHGFLTVAIGTEGLDVIPKLDAVCNKQYGGQASACQHGIGHGILEFLGHAHLIEALQACGRTSQTNPVAGCTSGVFMEYNVPISVDGNGIIVSEPRPLDRSHPYDPCPSLDTVAHQRSCYHELPQWWRQSYADDFASIGRLCENVPSHDFRTDCYDGVGNIVPNSADFDVGRARALCALMPSKEARTECMVVAADSFVSNAGDTAKAAAMCKGVEPMGGYICHHV